MRIAGQIMDIIRGWFNIFMLDHGAYVCFVS